MSIAALRARILTLRDSGALQATDADALLAEVGSKYLAKVRELAAGGATRKEIVAAIGCRRSTVYDLINRHQIPCLSGYSGGGPGGDRDAKLLDLLRGGGVTYKDAGDWFGITRERVRQIAKHAGVKVNGKAIAAQRRAHPKA